MVRAQIRDEDVRGLKKLSDVAAYAERLLNADALKGEFDAGVSRRKSFCEALDIGESTLSTWLQAGRVPRMAAIAYVLWLVVQKLTDELRQHEELAAEPYVIRCRDTYAVVQPVTNKEDASVDCAIASSIETIELAQEIATARSQRFRKLHDQVIEVMWGYAEQFDDEGDDNWVAELATELERARDFKLRPATMA